MVVHQLKMRFSHLAVLSDAAQIDGALADEIVVAH